HLRDLRVDLGDDPIMGFLELGGERGVVIRQLVDLGLEQGAAIGGIEAATRTRENDRRRADQCPVHRGSIYWVPALKKSNSPSGSITVTCRRSDLAGPLK